jgi:hypothetical protein
MLSKPCCLQHFCSTCEVQGHAASVQVSAARKYASSYCTNTFATTILATSSTALDVQVPLPSCCMNSSPELLLYTRRKPPATLGNMFQSTPTSLLRTMLAILVDLLAILVDLLAILVDLLAILIDNACHSRQLTDVGLAGACPAAPG